MYEIQHDQTSPVNIFAGDFPIVTEVGTVAEGTTIRKFVPVALVDGNIEEVSASAAGGASNDGDAGGTETQDETGATAAGGNIDNLCGIAADDSTDGGVVYYLTGEFFADGLTLPDGVTADDLKPAFRKLGIFLK